MVKMTFFNLIYKSGSILRMMTDNFKESETFSKYCDRYQIWLYYHRNSFFDYTWKVNWINIHTYSKIIIRVQDIHLNHNIFKNDGRNVYKKRKRNALVYKNVDVFLIINFFNSMYTHRYMFLVMLVHSKRNALCTFVYVLYKHNFFMQESKYIFRLIVKYIFFDLYINLTWKVPVSLYFVYKMWDNF